MASLAGGSGATFWIWVWTDRKSLEYVRTAKCLNDWQARGPFFFFSSIVSTSPSHIALAHKMLNLMHCPACFTLILLTAPPPASYLLPVWWEQSPGELTRRLNKLTNSLIPDGCPQNQLFVPASLRSHVIYWAHTSRLTCHQRGDVPRP